MAEFRVRCPNCSNNFCSSCSKEPYHLGYTCEEAERYANASHCRFCLEELKKPSSSRSPAFRACCDSDECVKVRDQCCDKKLACGHWCKGFKDEKVCLPCLDKKCIENLNATLPNNKKMLEDFSDDDYCGICMVAGLGQEPCVRLGNCKHIFHLNCLKRKVEGKWPSPRMTFDFVNCSACKIPITVPDHPELNVFLNKIYALKRDMENKAVEKAKAEGLEKDERMKSDPFNGDLAKYAVFKCAYYLCFSC